MVKLPDLNKQGGRVVKLPDLNKQGGRVVKLPELNNRVAEWLNCRT